MRDTTTILQEGFKGNLTTLRELQLVAGLSTEDAARVCMVPKNTYRRWRGDRTPNPTALRLLSIMAGYVPWHGWDGWEMHNGVLFPPGYSRNGIRPADILALPFTLQLLAEYRRQLKELHQRPVQNHFHGLNVTYQEFGGKS